MNIFNLQDLEDFGRIRLSKSFLVRDFLYSEAADYFGMSNMPQKPDLMVTTGRELCRRILEPLTATFGPLHIRTGYLADEICAITDQPNDPFQWDRAENGVGIGAGAEIVIPGLPEQLINQGAWRSMAYWFSEKLPIHQAIFSLERCTITVSWNSRPERAVYVLGNDDRLRLVTDLAPGHQFRFLPPLKSPEIDCPDEFLSG